MMKNSNDQIWLTSVLTDSDMNGAITLGFSLSGVFTSRKLGVIISPNVSKGLRRALNYCFDFVFYLDHELNTVGLENDEFVKVFALTLKSFKKIVMLSPTMLAIQNCDELFDTVGVDSNQPFMWVKEGDNSTLILYPSLPHFEGLMKGLSERNGTSVEVYLRKWLHNQVPNCEYLPDKYNQLVQPQTELLRCNDVSIVNLRLCLEHWLKEPNHSAGFIGQGILELWKRIQDENVLPLLSGLTNPTSKVPLLETTTDKNDRIAIVGMSCRYPGSNNLEEFWNILVEGKDATGNPPEFRWIREQCSRKLKPEYRKTNAGFLKCSVDDFDAKFFNISPKEMLHLDPQHRLLHELVWEALEDAAIDPHSVEGTNGGVFIGSWLNEYKEILTYGGYDEFYRMYMGTSIGAGAARISHVLGLTGPSIATESGCSSAMVALHLACKSLERRETNMALTCGVNLLLHPFDATVMPMVVSPEGRCKTFDAKADGFARAEGCGVLVLKRLSDAVRDGDKVWALIRGTGMTQEGMSKSMGTPTIHGESLAMKQALEDGNVDPTLVSYVEAHGTGTTVGDPLEVAAIATAYNSPRRQEPLLIGSVKTNVGHTESCSGITGIMKVVLAMHHEIIPPHRNFDTLNPDINLEAVPARIPLEPVKWPRKVGVPRLAGVSSFGITGTDAHAIVEEPPIFSPKVLTSDSFQRPAHIVTISAKTDEAMDILLESYKNHLKSSTSDNFADMAYTANIGRADLSQRAVLIANSREDAIKCIEQNKLIRGEETTSTIGKICFLFTGQGSQYPGMAKQLYETSPVFRMHFEYCEKILKNIYSIDITKVLWSEAKSSEVSRTIYSQTSIFCVEYALLKLWESWGAKADYALGHSLGEFAAAVCAGILSVEDAIKLVAERSRLIDELPRGKMLVIKSNKQQVDSLMTKFAANDKNKVLDYAAFNSPDQTVLAGDSDVILQFSECCKNANLKCIVLEATHAFHSKHMNPMLSAYKNVAKTIKKLGGNHCKYISGMKGTLLDANQVDAEYWVQHTREKVLFMDASKVAVELECKTFIEIGPQPVLSALTMMNTEQALTCVPSLKKSEKDWSTLLNSLGKLYVKGVEINWKGFDQFYNRKKVTLPHYPFLGKKYWTELMSVTGSSIHPLVGSVIPNASSTKLFENGLNLKGLQYVKDHAIGDNIIFPGAGYLEMCLAAGLASIEGATETLAPPTRPMKIENLSIQAPLHLQDSKTCQVQTIVEFNTNPENGMDWNDVTIKIFHKVDAPDAKGEWLSHATATYSPLPSAEDKEIEGFNPEQFKSTISQPSDDSILNEVYDKLASVGLKFGPTFRSIEKLWRDEESKTLVAKVKVPSVDQSQTQYILHPVILDTMIQAVMMLRHTVNIKKKLYVPISIGKFVWLASPTADSSELYIYVYSTTPPSGSAPVDTALLVDGQERPVALMSSVEFIDTTAKAIQAVLEQQTSSIPDMWENVWRPTENPTENMYNLAGAAGCFYPPEFEVMIKSTYNKPSIHNAQTFSRMCELVHLYFLRALYECGWEPTLHLTFSEKSLLSELKILKEFRKYFGFILKILEEEGILRKVGLEKDDVIWQVVEMPQSLDSVVETLHQTKYTGELVSSFRPTLLYAEFGSHLSGILQGTNSALPILFPEENKGWPSVSDFYGDYAKVFTMGEFYGKICRKRFDNVVETMEQGQRRVMRILEAGAGTGSYTSDFIAALVEQNVEFEYTYTDISSAFFPAAQKRFEKHLKYMKFRKLNIEEDPIEQGFTPEYFDYVFMAEVIHATKDIQESLKNLRLLMKPYAKLDMIEMTKVHRFVTFLFGSLDGFWRFSDFELRPDHCALSKETWTKVYQDNGFEIDGVLSTLNDYHSYVCVHKSPLKTRLTPQLTTRPENRRVWLLFHTGSHPISTYLLEKIGGVEARQVVSVMEGSQFEDWEDSFKVRSTEDRDFAKMFKSLEARQLKVEGIVYCWALDEKRLTQEQILQPYFRLVKSLLNLKRRVQPRLIAVTAATVPIEDNELSHFHASTLWAFNKSLKSEHLEINCRTVEVADGPLTEQKKLAIFYELWNTDKEVQVAYHGTTRYVQRLQPYIPQLNALDLPKGTDRFRLILPETKAISDLTFGPLDTESLKDDHVEIQIKASALNFRDVLSVIKPTVEFNNINSVGFDFSGVVKSVGSKVSKWKVGDRVIGCNTHFTALPSHVQVQQDLLMSVPEGVTFNQAATIPAVYMTSVMCLFDVAKIKRGDVVLVHTASGGVGLSAIEICKSVGATVIATAGSKRKQKYLKSIGIQHIFHSRNTKYGDQILEMTKGRGVDVVLNSLTSEGFKEATLKTCAKGAKFVEMSKLNIWKPEEVKQLRPDVEYTIVDLSSAPEPELKRLTNYIVRLIEENVVKPIPYVRYDALNIRQALEYLQKAKHVGKIVCVMPELRQEGGEMKVFTPMFNPDSSYLITGGLGGIGFVVCEWMLEQGAKHVVVASRSKPTLTIQSRIDEMNGKGANVITAQLDVSNFEQCKDLIENRMRVELDLPPLRGIMHAAGIIHDGLIENHEWESVCSTFHTKVTGTLNLHELTRKLDLEHFVTFSSSAALFGPPGQCNHAAANLFEDNFIHYRNSIGLPGTTVNWGPWGEVGVATEVDIAGLNAISNLQGIRGLEFVLKTQRLQTAIVNISSFVMLSKYMPYLSTHLDERVWKKNVSNRSVGIKSEEFWEQYDSKIELEGKTIALKEQIKNILRLTLKLDDGDGIDEQLNFQEMGVDSLMFVEIKNCLQILLGDRLTVNASMLKDCNNVNILSETLVQLIEGAQVANQRPPAEEVNELIREDCHLPDNITAKPGQKVGKAGDIKTVFLTGCTGMLGPYVLQRLTAMPKISQVVCLMRPSKQETGEERLKKLLEKTEILNTTKMRKVRCVLGNVALPHLGLDSELWQELSENMDAVVHCAAYVDHTEFYRKRESNSDTRAVNIQGTRNILEFACEAKLKQVYVASSLLSVAQVNEEGMASEDWPKVGDYDGVTAHSYPISKFVADYIVKEGVERGIPCKVFRLPLIMGESESGRCEGEKHHVLMRYMFMMKNGIMPSVPLGVPMLPVDTCADLSLQVFFNNNAPPDLYNVCHTEPDVDQEFVNVAKKLGYNVNIVEFSEFTKRIKESNGPEGQDKTLALFAEIYNDDEEFLEFFSSSPIIQQWMEGNKKLWECPKVPSLIPNAYKNQRPTMDYVYSSLLFMKTVGLFEKFGL